VCALLSLPECVARLRFVFTRPGYLKKIRRKNGACAVAVRRDFQIRVGAICLTVGTGRAVVFCRSPLVGLVAALRRTLH